MIDLDREGRRRCVFVFMTVERTGRMHRATVKCLTKVKRQFWDPDISEWVLLYARPPPACPAWGRVISGACRARAGRPQRYTQPFSAKGLEAAWRELETRRGRRLTIRATPVLVCIRLQGMTLEDPPHESPRPPTLEASHLLTGPTGCPGFEFSGLLRTIRRRAPPPCHDLPRIKTFRPNS